MGGMGLLRKRAVSKQNQPSAEAEEFLHQSEQQLVQRDPTEQGISGLPQDIKCWAQLEVIENLLAQVRTSIEEKDWVGALQQLEALNMLLDQQSEWTGVAESCRRLLHLITSAWVTVVRALELGEDLDTIHNWRYVLRQAITCTEQLSGQTCDAGTCSSCSRGLGYLQSLVEDEGDEAWNDEDLYGKDNVRESESLEFETQVELYLAQPGRQSATLGGDVYDLTNPERVKALLEGTAGNRTQTLDTGLEIQTDDLQEGTDLLDGSEVAAGGAMHARVDGRLSALDDVGMRPVLLRVVGRLPAEHPLRLEVQAEVGAEVGTAGWEEAVKSATTAAEAAGHVLPPPPAAAARQAPPALMVQGVGYQIELPVAGREEGLSGLPEPSPLLVIGGEDGGESGGAGGGLFSSGVRMGALDSRFALFGAQPSDDLLGEEDQEGGLGLVDAVAMLPTVDSQLLQNAQTGVAASLNSAVSEASVAMMISLGGQSKMDVMHRGPPPRTESLASLIPGSEDDGGLGDAGSYGGLDGGLDGGTDSLVGMIPTRPASTLPSPGLWGQGADGAGDMGLGRCASPSMRGGGDDLGGGDVDPTCWLLVDGEDGSGAADGWAVAGGGLVSPTGTGGGSGLGGLGKRSASLVLQRPSSKLSRMS